MRQFECPICGYRGPFVAVNPPAGPRKHALCPGCNALERHRLQYLVAQRVFRHLDTLALAMLHVAPEPVLEAFFRTRFGRYETADLHRDDVDHRVDLRALPFPDGTYDVVFASHVLEHIRDDEPAIAEIHRVLGPHGIAILPVPLLADQTIEYPEPNPYEADHVRAPGMDYLDRYRRRFSRVDEYGSEAFPAKYQLYIYQDWTRWPTPECPLRPPVPGERHRDVVPVCYV